MNPEELKAVTAKVNLYAIGSLSLARYEHSVRVAELARELCGRFGLDPDVGYFAGLAHDICKSGKESWLLELATKDGQPVSDIERRKPSLLHGHAAAVLLERMFGVVDRSILFAVRNHTFGAPDMDALGKIVFVADKIEPGRVGMDPEYRIRILESDLDGMTRLVVEDNIRYLEARGKEVSASTRRLLDNLKSGERLKK
jgi:nicotinate-nucleotide adenylyltransferase